MFRIDFGAFSKLSVQASNLVSSKEEELSVSIHAIV